MGRAPNYIVFIAILLLLFGCSTETSSESAKEDEEMIEETANEADVESEEDSEVEELEEKVEEEHEREEPGETETVEAPVDEAPESPYVQGDYRVYIGGEVVETDEKIMIYGESNLIPGSRVVGEVSVGKNIRYFLNPTVEDVDYLDDTSEIVDNDGNFYMELKHPQLEEETEVTVKFHFDGQQNDDVIRHYGDRGQKLEGPYIYHHQGEWGGRGPENIYQKAEVRTAFVPGKEKAIRQFSEPDWYEDPGDIGDPRVWIEVEEVNDDGEYFYVHGRSNLIEGSRIVILRNNRQLAETMINPDGSFNFSFDYEYKEEPFIIEFDPSDYQWNIVEETYGTKGQKLVGNLVVTNKYNDNQTIEYEVEHESQVIEVPEHVELDIDRSEVTMMVTDNILFDFGKHDLKNEAEEILTDISGTIENSFNNKELDITITGHTDNVGPKDFNRELSEKRAAEVKNYLAELLGATEITFATEGYGDTKPIASNDTEEGRAKNRRVEIIINLKQ